MLKLSILDFLTAVIPSGLIYILGIYVLNKKQIEPEKYWLASIITIFTIYGVRLLPINYGVHTILLMVAIVLIGVTILQVNMMTTIRAILLMTVVNFMSEGISIFVMERITRKSIGEIITNKGTKILCVELSLLLLLTIILVIQRIYKQTNKKRQTT